MQKGKSAVFDFNCSVKLHSSISKIVVACWLFLIVQFKTIPLLTLSQDLLILYDLIKFLLKLYFKVFQIVLYEMNAVFLIGFIINSLPYFWNCCWQIWWLENLSNKLLEIWNDERASCVPLNVKLFWIQFYAFISINLI